MPNNIDFINKHSRAYNALKDAGKEECIICLLEFSEDDTSQKIAELSCKHIYHEGCIKEWIKNNDICPICRRPIL